MRILANIRIHCRLSADWWILRGQWQCKMVHCGSGYLILLKSTTPLTKIKTTWWGNEMAARSHPECIVWIDALSSSNLSIRMNLYIVCWQQQAAQCARIRVNTKEHTCTMKFGGRVAYWQFLLQSLIQIIKRKLKCGQMAPSSMRISWCFRKYWCCIDLPFIIMISL